MGPTFFTVKAKNIIRHPPFFTFHRNFHRNVIVYCLLQNGAEFEEQRATLAKVLTLLQRVPGSIRCRAKQFVRSIWLVGQMQGMTHTSSVLIRVTLYLTLGTIGEQYVTIEH